MDKPNSREIPRYSGPRSGGRLMTRDEIRKRFDEETASLYSRRDPAYLPDYALGFDLLIDCVLAAMPSGGGSVLDLGAGTGNLTHHLLRRHSGCTATLIDFSENMLGEVASVLKDFDGRYRTVCDDFFSHDFPPASFDAVISSFAIHHARGSAEYLALYGKIRRWLKPGGVFACVDVVDGNAPEWSRLNEEGWKSYLSGTASFDASVIDHIFENYRTEDSPLSLPGHLDCLKEAGFVAADILWKRYNFAIYCAKA